MKWDVYAPAVKSPNFDGDAPEWLLRIQAMRDDIFLKTYPVPAAAIEVTKDNDPLDLYSYHVTASLGDNIIGCIRLTPHLTEKLLSDFVKAMALSRSFNFSWEALERPSLSSRWMVNPAHRSMTLAIRLIAGTAALGRRLGLSKVYGIVGTKTGQDRILARTGAAMVTEAGFVYCPRFTDNVRLIAYDLLNPPSNFSGMMEIMEKELQSDFTAMVSAEEART